MERGHPIADGFKALADLLREPLLLASKSGVIAAANGAAMRLFCLSEGELVGRFFSELVSDPEDATSALRTALRSRAFTPGSIRIVTGGGEAIECRCDGALYRDPLEAGGPFAVLRLARKSGAASEFVVLRDKIVQLSRENMARREAEQALARAAARLRVTLESIGDAVMATDGSGRIDFMNLVAEQLTGWSISEARGRHLDDVFVIVNEETRQPVESPVAKVLRIGGVVGLANHTLLLRRDGSELPIDDSGAPIRSPQGAIEGVVLVFRDLSDRHALERELLAKTARLQEADRRKDEFLSMLAHELRNPLAPIRNGVEIIRRSQTPPAVARTTEIMARQVAHMVRLVDDLLDVSRVNTGKIELRIEEVLLRDLLRDAEEMMRAVCEARGVDLRVVDPVPDAKLRGDAPRLVQVVTNLIGNAAKFSHPGGSATLKAVIADGCAEISVADEGVGIVEEHITQIFELFFQSAPGIGREHGGLGIGLTISRSIVEMHGGSLRVHSDGLGRGSTFTISLPLAG